MTTHANLSPSKRPRWSMCPASVRAEAQYPEEPRGNNKAATDGTHTHTLLSHCIVNQVDPESLIGQTLSDEDGGFVVDKDRAERVRFALDYINAQQINLGFPEVHSEIRVDPARIFGRDDLGGTIDILLVGADVIEIIDYKDGMSPVEATSLQLDQYGFGVIAMLGDDKFIVPQKTMKLTIVQPKMRSKGHPGIVSVETPMGQFMTGEWALRKQAEATDDPNAPFVPGDHCKYCRHGGACAARGQQAMDAAGIQFANLEVAQQAADKDPVAMSDDQIREIMEAAPLIRQLLEAVDKEALRRFNAGKPIAGLKMVNGSGTRSWAFPDEEMAAKLKRFGIPKEAIWETSLISPAKAEKATWTNRKGETKQLSERQLKLMSSEYITKSAGKLQVVPESDSRPAVSLNVSHLFQNVEVPEFLQVKE